MAAGAARLRLVLGDQLDLGHSWFRERSPATIYALMEVRQELELIRHHIQKIVATFEAMRRFAVELERRGHRVIYLRLAESDPAFETNIRRLVTENGCREVEYQQPDDYRVAAQLEGLERSLRIPVRCVESEHFLATREQAAAYLESRRRPTMDGFYRSMRRALDLLMDGAVPAGGLWSYDRLNRRRWDRALALPGVPAISNDCTQVHREIIASGAAWFGSIEPDRVAWPLDRRQALASLERFVTSALPGFGRYQDAMTVESGTLFHSLLSFPLNVKILRPLEVVDRAVAEWHERPTEIGLPDVEAFVRQIVGWREYLRGVYWARMPSYARENALGHQGPLPSWY